MKRTVSLHAPMETRRRFAALSLVCRQNLSEHAKTSTFKNALAKCVQGKQLRICRPPFNIARCCQAK